MSRLDDTNPPTHPKTGERPRQEMKGTHMRLPAWALAILVVGILVALIALAGCSDTTQDLENVNAKHPQKYEVYQSPDQFPNVGRVCIDNVAFATTTRVRQPLVRVPEWDDWCGAQK